MIPEIIIDKSIQGKCSNKNCHHLVKGNQVLCGVCRVRKSRLLDPVRYSYQNVKHRANERNIPFTLELGWFREFCRATGYIENKGRTSESFSIDRIRNDHSIGYTPDNIRVITKRDNILKYFRFDRLENKVIEIEPFIPSWELKF